MKGFRLAALPAAFLAALSVLSNAAWAQIAPSTAPADKSQAVQEAERVLWTPGEARYLRSWLVMGAAERPADEAGLRSTADWKPVVAWDDVVDLTAAGTEGRWLYALALVRRDAEGPAELSLGAGGPLAAWVNGAPVALPERPSGLYGAVRVPVRLNAGNNVVLLRAERGSGATVLTARILSPSQPLPDTRLQPGAWTDGDQLRVRTDAAPAPGTVTVLVTAPGGREMGRLEAARGTIAALPTTGWPDGPYEVEVRGISAAGRPLRAFSPWYKGDMAPAAKALLDQAAAATGVDAESGQWRMLADLVKDRAGPDLSQLKDAFGSVHSP